MPPITSQPLRPRYHVFFHCHCNTPYFYHAHSPLEVFGSSLRLALLVIFITLPEGAVLIVLARLCTTAACVKHSGRLLDRRADNESGFDLQEIQKPVSH